MESQLHILYIITQGVWGGAQRHVLDLVLNLAKNNKVTVAVGDQKGQKDLQNRLLTDLSVSMENVKVVQLNSLRRAINPFHDLLAILEIKKLVKSIKPDLVHLHSSKAGVMGSIALKNLNVPVVYTAHGWVFNEPAPAWKKKLYRYAEKYAAERRHATITLSPQDTASAKRLLGEKAEIYEVPVGIEPFELLTRESAKEEVMSLHESVNPKKKWICSISGHYKTKGLDVLIDAFSIIKETHPEVLKQVQCICFGTGPETAKLQALIDQHRLSNKCILVGFYPDAARLLSAFDLFVLPSRKEGLPYVLLEAGYAGLDIISTNVGGIPSLESSLPQMNLVGPEDSDELAKLIVEHIKTTSVSKKNAPVHTSKKMVKSIYEIYEKLNK